MDEKIKEAMRQSVVAKVKSNGNSLAGLTQGDIASYLSGMKDRVAAVLPKHLTAERVIQMAATTIQKNPAIAKCSLPSLLGGVMQASILGFPPVDTMGFCYFVPYGNDVQFQIGYKGLIDLAWRSGEIKSIYAKVVREGDYFLAEYGLNPRLEHKPKFDVTKPLTHAYAVCLYKNGGFDFAVLSKGEIERLRLRSPMQKGVPVGAWKTDYEAMAKAKAIKQLTKDMPLSITKNLSSSGDESIITPDKFTESGEFKIEEAQYEPIADNVDISTGEILNDSQSNETMKK